MSLSKKTIYVSILVSLWIIALLMWGVIIYSGKIVRFVQLFSEPKEEIVRSGEDIPQFLKLPDGFSASIFAENLISPRVMTYDPAGNLIVSITSQGRVVALPDKDGDGVADETVTVADGLSSPHGLAMRCADSCELYVGETDKVSVYDYEAANLKATNKRKIVDLPGGGHYTRSILFTRLPSPAAQAVGGQVPAPNDNKLLISVGSSCNVCNEEDSRRAKILVANADGSDLKEFARGLRNAVFMTIHPVTGKIWATEMGRDLLGDDIPPDEINIIEEGKNYGWPICYGKNIHDGEFDKNVYFRNPCMEPFETPSHIDIQAHSAPLGIAFVPEDPPSPPAADSDGRGGWPQEYWFNAFVAYHGSWNRSVPTGYKIVRYKLDTEGAYLSEEDFITGWLQSDGSVLGRPADILVQPGGVMFISDDKAGVIYRVVYKGKKISTEAKDKLNLIRIANVIDGATIKSPFVVRGEARGYWFFEASFPMRLYDGNGKEIAVAIAQAEGEWMTENFVPFSAELKFVAPATKDGVLVFQKDNPSGLPEYDDEVRIPVTFDPPAGEKPPQHAVGSCRATGCSGQVCSDKDVVTTCEFRQEYACYQKAKCERQATGECGWTQTAELASCLHGAQ